MSQALRKIRMAGGRSRAEMVTETACDMRGRAWGRPRDRPPEGGRRKEKKRGNDHWPPGPRRKGGPMKTSGVLFLEGGGQAAGFITG